MEDSQALLQDSCFPMDLETLSESHTLYIDVMNSIIQTLMFNRLSHFLSGIVVSLFSSHLLPALSLVHHFMHSYLHSVTSYPSISSHVHLFMFYYFHEVMMLPFDHTSTLPFHFLDPCVCPVVGSAATSMPIMQCIPSLPFYDYVLFFGLVHTYL